jgi:caffeic acid 3-O-methyltransferase
MLAYNKSLVLRAAIQLGLIDALCAAPAAVTADELARQIKAVDRADTAASVERILGYLACVNVVRCSAETTGPNGEVLRRYMPAPVCRWLTKNDGKGSLGTFAVFLGDPDHILPWYISSYSLHVLQTKFWVRTKFLPPLLHIVLHMRKGIT